MNRVALAAVSGFMRLSLFLSALCLCLGLSLVADRAEAQRRWRERPSHRVDHRWDRSDRYEPRPMDDASFEGFLQRVQGASFSSDRVGVVAVTAPHAYFTAAQIARVIGAMSFSSERTEVLDLLVPRLIDRHNGAVIVDSLTFSSEREHARALLAR